MAPSSDGQIALMQRVRDMAQRDNREITMIEAHGTGTPVGDPVEALSVGSVWAEGRDTPLLMGSSKSNFGHSEPAAGLVGLLKAVVSLERGLVPPTVFRTPNPAIDFNGLGVRLADAVVPMRGDLAVVNAFGFGGTNGCVLLQGPGPVPAPPRRVPKAPFLPLSAPTPEALSALAARWSQHLEGADMARMQRLAAAVWHGRDGAQAEGMGLAFHASDAGWQARFNEIASVFREAGGPDLTAALGAPDTGRIAVSQGLLFATQVATARALIAAGIKVAATIGHSVGEIAAAHVAGLLSLELAAHIILTRSERMQVLAGTGGMAVVNASSSQVTPLLARGVEVAALNGPESTTLSGPKEALTRTLDTLRRARLAAVRLPVTIPYHSAALDPLHAPMQADFADLVAAPGQIAFFGAAAGGHVAGAAFDGAYLWQNARAPVRFQAAAEAAFAAGLRIFAEIAPRPTLVAPLRAIFTDAAEATAVLASADPEMRTGARPADLAARL